MTDQARVVILCEDRQQEVFIRRFLTECGMRPIRVRICPPGEMAGEQFVRQEYPNEVRAFRSKAAYQQLALVVMIDADTQTVTNRLNALDTVLRESGQAVREADERIALLVPRRNIETWIHYLTGEPVNESDVYDRFENKSDCVPLVTRLAAKSTYRLRDDIPSSLRHACREIQRVLPDKHCVESTS